MPRTFEEQLLEQQASLYRLGYRLTRNEEDARDLVQETLTRALSRQRQWRGDCSLETWLYHILVNLQRSRGRRSVTRGLIRSLSRLVGGERRDLEPPAGEESHPDYDAHRSEQRDAVRRAIDELDPELREVTILRELQGLGYEEIARVLDIPLGTVRSRLHRARDRLRLSLEDWMKD